MKHLLRFIPFLFTAALFAQGTDNPPRPHVPEPDVFVVLITIVVGALIYAGITWVVRKWLQSMD